MKLNQKNFDELIESLNHKMTTMKNDIKWMKYIMYYIAGIMTVGFVGGLF